MIDHKSLPEPFSSYIIYLDLIKGSSPKTIDAYHGDIRAFYKFLELKKHNTDLELIDFELIPIDGITPDDLRLVTLNNIYEYLIFLSKIKHNSVRSRARKIASLRSFFSYLLKNQFIDVDPMANLETPKAQQSLPHYLDIENSKALINSISGRNAERDYCIIVLFLNCGMRLAELVGINITDITHDTIRIVGKGNKERIVYLNDACKAAIADYMKIRSGITATDGNKALFLSERKKRISRRNVQAFVEKYITKSGLDPSRFSTHKLRHTAATLMYQNGVDILTLKDILGHAKLSSTEIYTHVDDVQLRQAVSMNPLSNITRTTEDTH